MAFQILTSCFRSQGARQVSASTHQQQQQQQQPLLQLDARNPLLAAAGADDEAPPSAARGKADADADAPPNGPPVQVWILAGQSNCTGWNGPDGTVLCPPPDPPNNLVLMLSADGGALVAAREPTHLGVWGLDDRAAVGPGLSFARALRGGTRSSERPTVVLVPCARGGSSLSRDWAPGAPDGGGNGGGGGAGAGSDEGALYGCCARRARRAVELASQSHGNAREPRARLQGMVWVQGESDGAEERDARAYADNFAFFLESLRADLRGVDGAAVALPVVLVVAMASRGREGAFPYIRIVRERQLMIAAEARGGGNRQRPFSGVAALDMAGFEFFPDEGGQLVHLTKAGAAALGTALGLLAAAAVAGEEEEGEGEGEGAAATVERRRERERTE